MLVKIASVKQGSIILFLTGIILIAQCREVHPIKSYYGKIDQKQYLLGKFNPGKSPLFVKIKTMGISTDKRIHYLRKEAAIWLKKMSDAFSKENPGLTLRVISSTRTFYDQKWIWENKWTRVKKYKSIEDPYERALSILQYSSMPGTSRHHWGTDFDLNSLYNGFFKKGKGKIIYSWLVKHAHKYGFAQPYTANRKKGYNEERWHWSYIPLAKKFLKDWNDNFAKGDIISKQKLFKGAFYSGHLAPVYVNSINLKCK